MSTMNEKRDLEGALLFFLALSGAANGVWMLLDPAHWYHHLPAGVPDTGPLNAHFVRDIGCAFVVFSGALLWAWRAPHWRKPLIVTVAAFYLAHAALHVHDVVRGLLTSDHLLLDAWGVYLPAILMAALAFKHVRAPEADRPLSPPPQGAR